ncbi:MAG: hypothetical protein LAP13_00790 [Acidobacteriia bacterium]|nr:hypothetical protein [Terriglobia bacterium]
MRQLSRRQLIKALGGAVGSAAALTTPRFPVLAFGSSLNVKESSDSLEFSNGWLRARFFKGPGGIEQEYSAKASTGAWVVLAKAFHPPNPRPKDVCPLYGDADVAKEYRLLAADAFNTIKVVKKTQHETSVSLSGALGNNQLEQIVSLAADQDHFHIQVDARFGQTPPRLEYLLSLFEFAAGGPPDFTHVPCLKRAADDVIGDRIFDAPSTIIQKNGYMTALVPDLDLLNQGVFYAKGARPLEGTRGFRIPQDPAKISMPTIMDLDLKSGLTTAPLFAFGFADFIIEQHMFWRHENKKGTMVRELSTNQLRYGFDLFLRAEAPPSRGYQSISQFLWQQYGREFLRQPRPQAMPFIEYAKVCYPAAFAYKGDSAQDAKRYSQDLAYDPADSGSLVTWLEFDLDGNQVGGVRATPAQWYNDIQFSPWWNCARDAVGMYWWGKQTDPSLIEKARRIVNLALTAPQKQGIFPSIFRYSDKRWYGCYWKFPADFKTDWIFPSSWRPKDLPTNFWNTSSDLYQTAAASKTGVYLLHYRRLCEEDSRILPYLRPYGDFLIDHLGDNACIPAMLKSDLGPISELRFNGEGGIHIWFLCELYQATREKKYLDAAERIATFLKKEILPQQRWYDFETFYSCSIKPENFFDSYTGQWPQCTLSMLWAIDGFASLYEATGNSDYLRNAEAVADYAGLFQAVWQPHFMISAYVFGGFRSQNSDAEWLDMRQSLFGEALARLGQLAGRQDLLERGVAAVRASFAIINHPRHIENDIFRYPRYPFGIEPENIDHEGLPQNPLRSGFDWGEGGGLAAAATLLRRLGGAYLDFEKKVSVGVDGIYIKSFELQKKLIRIELVNQLALLPAAFNFTYPIQVRLEGLAPGKYELGVNGNKLGSIEVPVSEGVRLEIGPAGITKPISSTSRRKGPRGEALSNGILKDVAPWNVG